MKDTLKNIYLNFRKYLLSVPAILFSDMKLPGVGSGQDIHKILFVRIDRIGDLVLSTPAFKALKQAFPHCELSVLASHANVPILFNNPYIDQIIVYDHRQELKETIRGIRRLRQYGFDLAIDPYADYELGPAIIALLSGAKRRLGYASYGREVFFTQEAPEIGNGRHFIDLTLDVLKPLGIIEEHKKPEIFLVEGEKKWSSNWLKEKGVGGKPLVGIHPGGHYESQRWLPERFAELVNRLERDREVDLIIFGGPGDATVVDRIDSMIQEDVLTYITDDLRRFAALLSCCHVFICNNSGPLHMAVALNVPTISTMGPTNKDRWMPIGNIHKVLRVDDLPCIGCRLGYCKIKSHDCMRLISTSMVIDVAENLLRSKVP